MGRVQEPRGDGTRPSSSTVRPGGGRGGSEDDWEGTAEDFASELHARRAGSRKRASAEGVRCERFGELPATLARDLEAQAHTTRAPSAAHTNWALGGSLFGPTLPSSPPRVHSHTHRAASAPSRSICCPYIQAGPVPDLRSEPRAQGCFSIPQALSHGQQQHSGRACGLRSGLSLLGRAQVSEAKRQEFVEEARCHLPTPVAPPLQSSDAPS